MRPLLLSPPQAGEVPTRREARRRRPKSPQVGMALVPTHRDPPVLSVWHCWPSAAAARARRDAQSHGVRPPASAGRRAGSYPAKPLCVEDWLNFRVFSEIVPVPLCLFWVPLAALAGRLVLRSLGEAGNLGESCPPMVGLPARGGPACPPVLLRLSPSRLVHSFSLRSSAFSWWPFVSSCLCGKEKGRGCCLCRS